MGTTPAGFATSVFADEYLEANLSYALVHEMLTAAPKLATMVSEAEASRDVERYDGRATPPLSSAPAAAARRDSGEHPSLHSPAASPGFGSASISNAVLNSTTLALTVRADTISSGAATVEPRGGFLAFPSAVHADETAQLRSSHATISSSEMLLTAVQAGDLALARRLLDRHARVDSRQGSGKQL